MRCSSWSRRTAKFLLEAPDLLGCQNTGEWRALAETRRVFVVCRDEFENFVERPSVENGRPFQDRASRGVVVVHIGEPTLDIGARDLDQAGTLSQSLRDPLMHLQGSLIQLCVRQRHD